MRCRTSALLRVGGGPHRPGVAVQHQGRSPTGSLPIGPGAQDHRQPETAGHDDRVRGRRAARKHHPDCAALQQHRHVAGPEVVGEHDGASEHRRGIRSTTTPSSASTAAPASRTSTARAATSSSALLGQPVRHVASTAVHQARCGSPARRPARSAAARSSGSRQQHGVRGLERAAPGDPLPPRRRRLSSRPLAAGSFRAGRAESAPVSCRGARSSRTSEPSASPPAPAPRWHAVHDRRCHGPPTGRCVAHPRLGGAHSGRRDPPGQGVGLAETTGDHGGDGSGGGRVRPGRRARPRCRRRGGPAPPPPAGAQIGRRPAGTADQHLGVESGQ